MVKQISALTVFRRTFKRFALRGFVVLALFAILTPLYIYTRERVSTQPVLAATGINHQISFQGKLVNTDGTNVTDGSYSIDFSIYTVASAGSNIWTETQSVTLSNGIFQVNLGSVTALPASVDFNTDNIYLGIKVGTDAEMTPRVQFTAVPQAFNAEKLGGLDKTGFIQNSTTLQSNTNFNIQSAAAGSVGGVIRGATSQTADLLQLQDSAGTTKVRVTANGGLQGFSTTGDVLNFGNYDGAGHLRLDQSGIVYAYQFSSQGFSTSTSGNSRITNTDLELLGTSRIGGYQSPLIVQQTGGGNVGQATLVVRAIASQTADLLQVQNSSGTVLSSFDANGNLSTQNITLAAQKTLRLTGGTTAQRPASPSEGQIYFDNDTKQLLVYGGGVWQNMSRSSTKVVSASNSQTPAGADYQVTAAEEAAGNADAKINAAITALPAGGGTVYLMEGTYTLDNSVLVPANVTLTGSGANTILKIKNALNANLDNSGVIASSGSPQNQIRISNLTVDGNSSNQTAGTNIGIQINNSGSGTGTTAIIGTTIDNVTVQNFQGNGITISGSHNTVTNSRIINSGTSGFAGIYVNTTYATITGNKIYGAGSQGIYVVNNYATITGNLVEGSGRAIYINSNFNTITGNTVKGGVLMCVYIYGGANNTVSGNSLSGCGSNGIETDVGASNNSIIGNAISSNNGHGIYLISSNTNTVSGNKIHDNGFSGASDGIRLSASDNNSITNNDITDTAGTGFAINVFNATSDTNYLSGNRFSGTGATSINNAGTGTIYANQLDASGNLINRNLGGYAVGKTTAGTSFDLQGSLRTAALPTPAAVTLTTSGTAGATTYGYRVSALDGLGETLASTETTIATGNATLTATNKINIAWVPVGGAVQYKVFRSTSAGTPASTGLISTVAGNVYTLSDTGLVASGAVAAANTTGTLSVSGSIQGGSSLSVGTASTTNGSLLIYNAANAFTVTVQTAALTANRVISFPDAGGTVCTTATSCAPLGGSTNYIQNGTSLQTSANFNFQSAAAGSVGGVIRGAASQTADLLQLQDSTGTAVAQFSNTGNLSLPGLNFTSGASFYAIANTLFARSNTFSIQNVGLTLQPFNVDATSGTSGPTVGIVVSSAGKEGLQIKAAASQTADLLQIQDSAGTILNKIDAAGKLYVNNNIIEIHNNFAVGQDLYTHSDTGFRAPQVSTYRSRNTQLAPTAVQSTDRLGYFTFGGYDGSGYVQTADVSAVAAQNFTGSAGGTDIIFETASLGSTNASTERLKIAATGGSIFTTSLASGVGLTVKGAASQTADLLQLQDSTGALVTRLTSTGNLSFGAAGSSTNYTISNQNSGAHITLRGTNVTELNQPAIILGGTTNFSSQVSVPISATGTVGQIIRGKTFAATVTNKALITNVATLTTSVAHNFQVGKSVIVSGVDATFDGTYTIASIPSATTFTYAKTATDVASAAATGTATSYAQTGDLIQLQDSSGLNLVRVTSAGILQSFSGKMQIARADQSDLASATLFASPYYSSSAVAGFQNQANTVLPLGAPALWSSSGGSSYRYELGPNYLSAYTAGSQRLYIDSTGNVGISSTATLGAGFDVTRTLTAISGSAIGSRFQQALTASNNNDTLTGLLVNPNYTNGAFTGVTNIAAQINTGSSSATGLIVKAAVSQTGDLFQLQDSTGAVLSNFVSDGGLRFSQSFGDANYAGVLRVSPSFVVNNKTISAVSITPAFTNASGGTSNALLINPTGDSNSSILRLQNNGSDRFVFNGLGNLTWSGSFIGNPLNGVGIDLAPTVQDFGAGDFDVVRINPTSATGPNIKLLRVEANGNDRFVVRANAGDVITTIKGAASQTADLLQLQNSSGTVLSAFDNNGNLGFNQAGSIKGLTPTVSNAAGFSLSVAAGAANGSTTGAAGGSLILAGGAAAGTSNNNGGNVNIDGGAKSGAGRKGDVVVQTGGGNTGIGTASNLVKLTVKANASSSATGTVAIAASPTINGTSTVFATEVAVGDRVTVNGETRTVTAVNSNSSLTVDTNFSTTASGQTMTILPALLRLDTSGGISKLSVDDQGKLSLGMPVNFTASVQSPFFKPGQNLSVDSASQTTNVPNAQFTLSNSLNSGLSGNIVSTILNPGSGSGTQSLVGIGSYSTQGYGGSFNKLSYFQTGGVYRDQTATTIVHYEAVSPLAGYAGTTTNQYGLFVGPLGNTGSNIVSNAVGAYIGAQTGNTTGYGLYFAGDASTAELYGAAADLDVKTGANYNINLSPGGTGHVGVSTTVYGTNNRLLVNPYNTVDNLATAQISTNAATNKGLVVQGFGGQSANLFEIQNNGGTSIVTINSSGTTALPLLNVGGATQAVVGVNTPRLFTQPLSDVVGVIFKGNASQTTDLLQLQNSAGTVLTSFDASGKLTLPNNASLKIKDSTGTARDIINFASDTNTYWGYTGSNSYFNGSSFNFTNTNAAAVNLTVKGAASQSSDLLQLQNSSGTKLTAINATGSLTFGASAESVLGRNSTNARVELTGTDGSLFIEDRLSLGVQTLTILDDGNIITSPAANLTPTASYVEVDCQDINGCTVDVLEASAKAGDILVITSVGTGSATVANTANIIKGSAPMLGTDDTAMYIYTATKANNLWLQLSTSNN